MIGLLSALCESATWRFCINLVTEGKGRCHERSRRVDRTPPKAPGRSSAPELAVRYLEEGVHLGMRIEKLDAVWKLAQDAKKSGKSADGLAGGRGKKKNHRGSSPKVSQD